MKDGAIQQVAEPGVVYRQPANRFVAAFIGFPTMNFFNGTLVPRDGALFFEPQAQDRGGAPGGLALRLEEPIAGRMKDWAGRNLILGIRPEHIGPTAGSPSPPPGRTVEAVVESVQPMGAESYLSLSGPASSFVARVPARDTLRASDRVSVVFDMAQAHFFDRLTEKAIS